MNVTSTSQTQYTATNTSNTKTQDTSAYDEVAKKKQPTRYETLLDMNYDNMSEVERRELSYYSARRPMKFLDEEGNKALNKALEGKTDAEMFQIKGILELEFMTSVKFNAQGGLDRQMFDSVDTSKDATVDRFEKFMQEAKTNGTVDNIGLLDVMEKFLGIYNKTPSDIKNQEDSVVDDFFEDLYSKESINFTSNVTKQDIQDQVKEYAAFLEQELGSSDEAKSIMANLMTEYKTAVMDELKKSIDSTTSTSQEKQYMREHASFDIDKFIEETLSKDYHPKKITFEDIATKVDDLLNPKGGGSSSPEFKESVANFWTLFQANYVKVQEENEIIITTQKEIEIKEASQKILDEEKEEPLATAIEVSQKETRTSEEIIAEYRAMPGQGGIFVEGMFEEKQAADLAKHEPYFKAEYEHYEKYQDIFTPIYSNYTTQKANKIGTELNAQFPEFGAMREKAYMGGTEQDKEAFEDMFWDYQAFNKYLREKYDMDMSTGGFNAATKESSKAYNLSVYDSLESGLSIGEATKKVQSLLSIFGGSEAQAFSLMFFSGLPEDIEAATEIPEEEIDYDKQINLTDYGIEHNFWSDAYLNTYGNDSIGVKSRIMYDIKLYSFLLENHDVVNTKLDELKERAYETENGTDWYDRRNEDGKFNERFKSGFQEKYDNAIYAKEIYDKYADRIFDNTIINSANNIEDSSLEQVAS